MIMKLYRKQLKREIKEELDVDIDVKNKLGEEHYSDEKINVHYIIFLYNYKW